jgi:S1-C subfamily serine protease
MPGRFPTAALPAALATFAMAAGCGGDDSEPERRPAQKVETTRVQVVEQKGGGRRLDAEALYDRLSPGVVTVVSKFDGTAAPLLDEDGEGGQGSGFVLDGDGRIATNAHVVTTGRPPRTKRAKEVYVAFADGNQVPAKVVGDDPNADVALLEVDPKGLSLTPLKLGSSRNLRVGEPVAAIGSPFSEEQSLSLGVISALNRNIESLTAFHIGDAIQTDAAINPGNSGGPLLNARGEVLGINAQIKSQSGGGEGVGFAVPVGAVRRSLRELRRHGRVRYGYLGVETRQLYPQLAEKIGLDTRGGALITRVEDDSPAKDAGLEAGDDELDFQIDENLKVGGDVIVAVDGRKVTRRDDLADLISRRSEGDEVELEVLRGDNRRTVKLTLGKRPNRAPPRR